MNHHAILSPSKGQQHLSCPGSLALEFDRANPATRDIALSVEDAFGRYPRKRTSNADADEGTAAHLLGSWCLTKGTDALDYLGHTLSDGFTATPEMCGHVQVYVDAVRERMKSLRLQGCTVDLYVEVRVPVGHITGEDGAEGTADAVLVITDKDDVGSVEVWDLKYGIGVVVDAQGNEQGQLYALGVLHMYELLNEFRDVTVVISQPRVKATPSRYDLTVDALKQWGEEASAGYAIVRQAFFTRSQWIDKKTDYLSPGVKQCKFCTAKKKCPAYDTYVQDTVGVDFDDLDSAPVAAAELIEPLDDDEFVVKLAAVDLIEAWCREIRSEAERRLHAGIPVKGFKLVRGRKGNRKWSDEAAVEKLLKEKFRLVQDEMYEFKLLSPPKAETFFKESPRRWAQVAAFIAQADGAPTVMPESDPRPAITTATTSADFDDDLTA